MSKLKETMIKGMDKIMLNCDDATFLATKDSVDKIGCIKKTQLRLHLMGCKLCRSFVRQTKLISEQMSFDNELNKDELKLHLTVVQKESLEKIVQNNIE